MTESTHYTLTPETETDRAQFDNVVENLKNVVASMNSILTDRAREGVVVSENAQFDAVPGTQVLTPRQYGVVKVRVWDLWQTGLLQSLVQGRPVIYEESVFSADPDEVNMQERPDESAFLTMMYFGDDFDLDLTETHPRIDFYHDINSIRPTGILEGISSDELEGAGIQGVQLNICPEIEVMGVELKTDTEEMGIGQQDGSARARPWWMNGTLSKTGERRKAEILEELRAYDSIEEDGATDAFENAVDYLRQHVLKDLDIPLALPGVVNMVSVHMGVWETAEILPYHSEVEKEMANLLGLSTYSTETREAGDVIYSEPRQRAKLEALDKACQRVTSQTRRERLIGWMYSYPEDALDYSSGRILSSEKSMIDVIDMMERRDVDSSEVRYLLLLPYQYNTNSPEAVERDISRGKRMVSKFEEFDSVNGTDILSKVFYPSWAFQGDVVDLDDFHTLIDGSEPSTDFWRI